MRFVLLAGVAAAVLGAAGTAAPQDVTGPRVRVEPEAFDFGKVKPGRTLRKDFRLRNIGDRDLVIERISKSCRCTRAETDTSTLTPGASTALRVEIQTPASPGEVELRVLVRSNDPETPSLEVLLRATVVAAAR